VKAQQHFVMFHGQRSTELTTLYQMVKAVDN